jgi:hypothetical protein
MNGDVLARHCAVCGRSIKLNSRYVEGLGYLGPECHSKVAAFPKWLEYHGLTELVHGKEIEAIQKGDDYDIPEGVLILDNRLKAVGFCLRKEVDTSKEPWRIRLHIEFRNTKQARQQFSKAFARFQDELLEVAA